MNSWREYCLLAEETGFSCGTSPEWYIMLETNVPVLMEKSLIENAANETPPCPQCQEKGDGGYGQGV